MTPSRRISIVIPARNEAAGLRQLLPGLVGLGAGCRDTSGQRWFDG